MSAGDTALVALADHSMGCRACRPDPDRPGERPQCAEAMRLYRAWRRACRTERRTP